MMDNGDIIVKPEMWNLACCNSAPLVSIVVAAFNERPDYIENSIGSLVRQTYSNIEIFVLDDSTREETITAINRFSCDQRVKVIRKEKRMGFVPALNCGLELAKGTYIARMDADDRAALDRIEKQVAYLEEHKDVHVLGGQINIISETGEFISNRRYPLSGWKFRLYATHRFPIAHPAVMMRRELIDEGYRYDESLKKAEDLDLWLRILNGGYKFANLPDILLDYRVDQSFNEKRTQREARKTVVQVRTRNFNGKKPLFSIASVVLSNIYLRLPSGFIGLFYNRENGKNGTAKKNSTE